MGWLSSKIEKNSICHICIFLGNLVNSFHQKKYIHQANTNSCPNQLSDFIREENTRKEK